jgi:NADH-quinone oxidoreductase subunit M
MTGAYGLVRVIIPIAPTWLLECVSLLSLATAIYASGMVLVQNTMRGFYCFLLLSYTSLILVGLESLSRVGLTGSLSLWLSVGISMISLGLVMRAVESRVGRISLTHYSGLYGQMPWLGGCFLLAVLSSIGFPGTVGFIGVELLVDSALVHNPLYAATIVLTLAINGIGALRVYFRIFAGPTTSATLSLQPKFTERTIFLALALLIIAGGLFPQSGIGTRYHAAREILLRRGQLYDLHAQPAPTDSSLSP